jgi:hypothetical protein
MNIEARSEVEQLVEAGDIEPDHIVTAGIFLKRIVERDGYFCNQYAATRIGGHMCLEQEVRHKPAPAAARPRLRGAAP